jgi:hypothetical protein
LPPLNIFQTKDEEVALPPYLEWFVSAEFDPRDISHNDRRHSIQSDAAVLLS